MAETAVAQQQKPEVKEPLFGKKEKKLITDPLGDNNPITIQVLGICSACLLYTSPSPRDQRGSRMPSSA